MKHILFRFTVFFTGIFFSVCSFSQALVTYGDQKISKEEFLNAYRKNNASGPATEKSYQDYLDLYIRYRLKVRAAYDLKLDTLPAQQTELKNFRSQIMDQYTTDETSVQKLVAEAFVRSQKDIRISQIFISAPRTALPADTLKAYKKAQQAYAALKLGKDFGETALAYSEDPFVKTNKGDLGYITVFSLPYTMESLAYRVQPGKFSAIFRGPNGYHIFKNTGSRKPLGKVRVSQILLIYPYNSGDEAKADVKKRADSIYHVLLAGGEFNELAKKFSGDNLSYQSGGEMPEFGVGKYDPEFESKAFALTKDGAIAEPFPTSFGYHIIKRISRKPVPATQDKKYTDLLRQEVMDDPRIEVSKKAMLQTIQQRTGFKRSAIDENHIWSYTDSILLNKKPPVFADLNEHSALFSFSDKSVLLQDWLEYRKSIKSIPSLTNGKTERDIYDRFSQQIAFEYYKNHLENYNPAFAAQVEEFKDGNLLFEIMQRNVWDKASADTAGLKQYFDAHADQYWWQPSADAIIFTASDETNASLLLTAVKKNVNHWKGAVDSLNGKAQADSGRFELKQIPGTAATVPQANDFTAFIRSVSDQTVQFAYIIKDYDQKMPRSYNEARGLVINDYQAYLENQWIEQLKIRYPVQVNQTVFKSLLK